VPPRLAGLALRGAIANGDDCAVAWRQVSADLSGCCYSFGACVGGADQGDLRWLLAWPAAGASRTGVPSAPAMTLRPMSRTPAWWPLRHVLRASGSHSFIGSNRLPASESRIGPTPRDDEDKGPAIPPCLLDSHDLIKASRSLLSSSAWVMNRPCAARSYSLYCALGRSAAVRRPVTSMGLFASAVP
jgi:hypothetical protein